MGGNVVEAFLGASGQRDNEAQVHHHGGEGETDAQVVAMRLVDGQAGKGDEQDKSAEQTGDIDPVGGRGNVAEAFGIEPGGRRAGQTAFAAEL